MPQWLLHLIETVVRELLAEVFASHGIAPKVPPVDK